MVDEHLISFLSDTDSLSYSDSSEEEVEEPVTDPLRDWVVSCVCIGLAVGGVVFYKMMAGI
jgi:hypothetical protein